MVLKITDACKHTNGYEYLLICRDYSFIEQRLPMTTLLHQSPNTSVCLILAHVITPHDGPKVELVLVLSVPINSAGVGK